jgi:hypothetical protein
MTVQVETREQDEDEPHEAQPLTLIDQKLALEAGLGD